MDSFLPREGQEFSHGPFWRKPNINRLRKTFIPDVRLPKERELRECPPGKVFFSGLGGCLPDLIEDHVQKISSVRLDFPVITDDSLRPRIFPDRIRIKPEEIDEGHRDLSCVSSEIPVLLPRLFPERKARLKTSDKFYPVEVGVGYRGVFCPPGCAVEDGAFDRESPDPLRKPGSMIPCQDENRL